MRAVQFSGPHRSLSVEDVERPTAPAGNVLVSVEAAGVCGTELHFPRWPPHAREGRRLRRVEVVDGFHDLLHATVLIGVLAREPVEDVVVRTNAHLPAPLEHLEVLHRGGALVHDLQHLRAETLDAGLQRGDACGAHDL